MDFSKVKFDEDRKPYVVERAAKGQFQRRYLNDAEQQAHKEWDCERVSRLNSAAVAPARGQTHSTQTVDTLGLDRAEARNSTLRSGYRLQDGPTGAVGPGPCPVGAPGMQGDAGSIIPVSLSVDTADEQHVPIGQRVARRSVTLLDSISRLTIALYDFGAIDNACVADVRSRIMRLEEGNCDDEDAVNIQAEDMLIEPYYYVKIMAEHLYRSYSQSRTQAPLKVVGHHAAPVFTLTQYLMGLVFPEGDMAARAQAGPLLNRYDESVHDLVMDITTVYNNIQADISEAGNRLLGIVPEEIGPVGVAMGDLPALDVVRATDEMLAYLVERIDNLTSLISGQL